MNEHIKVKPRDRIVATAARLFYKHGINAVGIAQICKEANVSKRTLYKYFDTKEALVVASMSQLGDAWFEACTSADSDDPRERINHVFKMFVPMAEKEDFFGCILMNISIELRSTKAPGVMVVREFKAKLYEYFRQQAVLLNYKDPDVLAEQLVVLYDGCSAWIVMRRKFPASTFHTLSLLLVRQ
jgi:AcrR family transcriptional regulator